MPLSWHGQVGVILDAVVRRAPRSVLDIGCGYGAIAPYLRQYGVEWIVGVDADLPDGAEAVGLEGYSDLIEAPWPGASQRLDTIDPLGKGFDLALMIDVVEHAELALGLDMLAAALESARAVVVATPHDPMRWPQDDLPNPYEQHRRRWQLHDLTLVDGGFIAEAHHLAESIVVVLERWDGHRS